MNRQYTRSDALLARFVNDAFDPIHPDRAWIAFGSFTYQRDPRLNTDLSELIDHPLQSIPLGRRTTNLHPRLHRLDHLHAIEEHGDHRTLLGSCNLCDLPDPHRAATIEHSDGFSNTSTLDLCEVDCLRAFDRDELWRDATWKVREEHAMVDGIRHWGILLTQVRSADKHLGNLPEFEFTADIP